MYGNREPTFQEIMYLFREGDIEINEDLANNIIKLIEMY